MLTQPEIAPYLLRRNLVSAESIVESDLVVVDASRRNLNFKVISQRRDSYLLKQGTDLDGVATVAHEAAVYELLQSCSGDDAPRQWMQRYLPRCYGYDPQERILILELAPDAQDFREHQLRCGRFSTRLAAVLGTALGALRRSTKVEAMKKEDLQWLSHMPPGVLSIHRPQLAMFRDVSSGNVELIQTVQQSEYFCRMLDELREGWRAETLIHGDIKWDNCILSTQSSSRRRTRLKIIDWEFAGIGDPLWDVGAVFSNYLSFWLFSIPITGEGGPGHFLHLSRFPLEKMQPALRAFWRAYLRQLERDTAQADEWLLRAARYGAARLVQTAFEQLQTSLHLAGNIACLLQLSMNIMQRPHEAVVQLLGIPLRQLRIA